MMVFDAARGTMGAMVPAKELLARRTRDLFAFCVLYGRAAAGVARDELRELRRCARGLGSAQAAAKLASLRADAALQAEARRFDHAVDFDVAFERHANRRAIMGL